MKISFSTLGCPEWAWEEMLATAKDLGFDGVEVRGIENEIYVPKAKPFLKENIENTKKRLARMNLEISCLTSSCYLFNSESINMYIEEGKEYIDVAEKMGTPFVRVLGDPNPQPGESIDVDFVAQNLAKLAEYAKGKNVRLLIETNGLFADSRKMLELLKKANHPNIGVLWDIHHPYRFFGEPIQKTYEALKDYISFIHIKDSEIENNRVKYRMMGYGDIPVREALCLLSKNNYKGYVSLEWVKRWCNDLEEPGIVFSHFVNYVRGIVG